MKTPEFLYFDIGRVLLDFDHERMLGQMAAVAGVSVETMRGAIMPSGDPTAGDPQWRLEAGQLSEDEYYDGLCERLGTKPPREELNHAASNIFTPIEATLRLAEQLQAGGHRLGLLSNTNPIHWRFFLDGRYPTLCQAFDIRISSFGSGTMKPDAKIYRDAIRAAGVAAERIFFTDDRPENVEGALACGIDAVLFNGVEQLTRDLADRGVTVE